MYGGLECARVLRRFALQRGVSVGGQEGPLVQFLLPLEGYVQRRLVPLSRYSEASGAVEDDVDLRVFSQNWSADMSVSLKVGTHRTFFMMMRRHTPR